MIISICQEHNKFELCIVIVEITFYSPTMEYLYIFLFTRNAKDV